MATGGNSLPAPSCADDKKRRVCYYYDPGIAHIKFSDDHVMVPARVAMAHSLVGVYGMLGDMRRLRTRPATEAEIRRFHSPEYVDLLRDLTPESYANDAALRQKAEGHHGIGGDDDCPAFDRLWKYCRGYAGGSLAAARALVDGAFEITINWSGGMHHASACKASGFCYINNTLIAINELLPYPCRPGRHCAAAELPESSVPPCIAAPCAGMPPCILVVGGEPRRCAAAPPWPSYLGSGRPRVSRLCSAQRGRRRGKERKESRGILVLTQLFPSPF